MGVRWRSIVGLAVWIAILSGLTEYLVVAASENHPRYGSAAKAYKSGNFDTINSALIAPFVWVGNWTHDGMVAGGTIIIALFTFVLGVGTAFLVLDGKEHSRRQLRAYVSATPNFIFAINKTVPVTIRYSIRNHGSTPAHQMMSLAKLDVLDYPLPKDWIFPPPSRAIRGSKSTLYADNPRNAHSTLRRLLTAQELIDIGNGTNKRLYIFGAVLYFDIFGREQTSEFCYSVIGGGRLQGLIAGRSFDAYDDVVFEASDQHNDST